METNVGKAIREYDELHAVCPACGSRNYETTLMGYAMEYSPEVRVVENRNRVCCQSCGWGGRGHDLVPAKK